MTTLTPYEFRRRAKALLAQDRIAKVMGVMRVLDTCALVAMCVSLVVFVIEERWLAASLTGAGLLLDGWLRERALARFAKVFGA